MKHLILSAILSCNSLALLLMAGHEVIALSVRPEIACEFETVTTTATTEPVTRKRAWRLLRSANEVEAREADGKSSEVWERNPRGQLTYCRVFHPEKRVVAFNPVDRAMMANRPDWDQISCMLPRHFVDTKLKEIGSELIFDRPAIRDEGESEGIRYEVLWLKSEQIPAWIRETKGNQISTTTLQAIHRLDDCPWPHGEQHAYRARDLAGGAYKESAPALPVMPRQMKFAVAHPSYYPALAK